LLGTLKGERSYHFGRKPEYRIIFYPENNLITVTIIGTREVFTKEQNDERNSLSSTRLNLTLHDAPILERTAPDDLNAQIGLNDMTLLSLNKLNQLSKLNKRQEVFHWPLALRPLPYAFRPNQFLSRIKI